MTITEKYEEIRARAEAEFREWWELNGNGYDTPEYWAAKAAFHQGLSVGIDMSREAVGDQNADHA